MMVYICRKISPFVEMSRQRGGENMELKLIDSSSVHHVGYGAGSGEIITKKYECPCGKGAVTYERDDIPGFKSTDIWCDCKECNEKYEFLRGGIVKEK
jgi:hypothetical protein